MVVSGLNSLGAGQVSAGRVINGEEPMKSLTKEQLGFYRKLLLEQRERILNRSLTVANTQALALNSDDMADESDHAAAVIQQGLLLNVQERDRHIMREIEHALSKFEQGIYGLCEDTEEPIDEERLKAQPWTRYCVEAAEVREKKAKRYAGGSRSY